jgi:hypothetical protein
VIPLWATHSVNARVPGDYWHVALPADHRDTNDTASENVGIKRKAGTSPGHPWPHSPSPGRSSGSLSRSHTIDSSRKAGGEKGRRLKVGPFVPIEIFGFSAPFPSHSGHLTKRVIEQIPRFWPQCRLRPQSDYGLHFGPASRRRL